MTRVCRLPVPFVLLSLVFAVVALSACGGGDDTRAPTPALTPTPGPPVNLPAPIPFEITGPDAILATPDEPASRLVIGTMRQAGGDVAGVDALVVPLAGVGQSLLILEIEASRAPATRDDAADLKALQAVANLGAMTAMNVTRVAFTQRNNAAVMQTTSVAWATFQARVKDVTPPNVLFQALAGDATPPPAGDPAVQASQLAPLAYQNKALADLARSRAIIAADPEAMDKAIELQPYNVKYLLEKAELLVANGKNADQTKGQALYLLQKQATEDRFPTSLGPQTAAFTYVFKYAGVLLDRVLDQKSQSPARHENLKREYCDQDRLMKQLYSFPLAGPGLCG